MKRYKVLWPHVGDKEYATGDERVADETAVAHLVTPVGSTLELIGDALDVTHVPVVTDANHGEVSDLQAQIVALTQERDEARAEVERLRAPAVVAALDADPEPDDDAAIDGDLVAADAPPPSPEVAAASRRRQKAGH